MLEALFIDQREDFFNGLGGFLRARKKQITIYRRRPEGSVEVLLVEFDRQKPRARVIKDRYVIDPNEVIMLGRRT